LVQPIPFAVAVGAHARHVARAVVAVLPRLLRLRRQKGLSQSELGRLADLHDTHIGHFERGTSRPGGDTLKRLADALDVTGITCWKG
ncbi:helix-turn-helix domain-containing protein, partial [Lonsdalea quercina]|uniref:helix-turn-helix domain-containing protein n=1 Tax=Lonsdalea quercina TaxID=71657 RepID=UPI00397634BD